MVFLRKYNTIGTIRIPLLKADGLSFATDAYWTPGAGDVTITKDGGSEVNITDLPTYVNGQWAFTLTTTETTCQTLTIKIVDALLLCNALLVETFGHASAFYVADFTADGMSVAEIQAGLATSIALGDVDTVVDAIKVKTDYLPSATAGSAGGVFIAGSNAATSITTALTANITGNLSGSVGSVANIAPTGTGLTAIPWNASWDAEVQSEVADALAVYDPPTNAELEARTIVSANYATAAELAVIESMVGSIGSGTGAALNFAAIDDNVDGPLAGETFVGTQTSNTFASTAAEDGTRHVITDSGSTPDINIVYKFNIGAGRNAAKVVWKGYVTNADTITFKAYNGSTWDTRATVIGTSSTTNVTKDISLLASHTLTGANAGEVYIQLTSTGQSSIVVYTDELLVAGVAVGISIGYSQGAVWVDSAGTSGTTAYINGTADNPCPWADALVVAAAVGLKKFIVAAGTSITLGADLTESTVEGRGYTLALAGYDISTTTIMGCETLSGTGTATAHEAFIWDCQLGSVTLGEVDIHNAHLTGTVTLSEATATRPYLIHRSVGVYVNGAYPTVDFGAAVGATFCNISSFSGGINIANMKTGDVLSIDGNADVTLAASCTGGTVYINGAIRLTNSGSDLTIYKDDTTTKTALIPASPAAVGSAMTLATGAIVGDSFDKVTAFPIPVNQATVLIPGIVDDTAFTPTITEFESDTITEATANHYNGRVIVFTSGDLAGQACTITAYALASGRGHFTVSALTEAPANNVTFTIY